MVHTESYKMLATTPGRSIVDTHSRSVFVKGELSISNAKGQLLLAGLSLTGGGTTVGSNLSVRWHSQCALPLSGSREMWLGALCIAMRPDRCKNPLWFYSLSTLCVCLPGSPPTAFIPMMQQCCKDMYMLCEWRPSRWSRKFVYSLTGLHVVETAHQNNILVKTIDN